MKSNYIETFSQKGFTPGMSGRADFSHIICQAKRNQRSLVVSLLDLKQAFGELHHNLILVVLAQHHIADNIIKAIMPIFEDFVSTTATVSFTSLFCHIKSVY